ncbi:hypothetical protein STANM309S_06288 [Streptomyces tanashiensis]
MSVEQPEQRVALTELDVRLVHDHHRRLGRLGGLVQREDGVGGTALPVGCSAAMTSGRRSAIAFSAAARSMVKSSPRGP